jgi:serine/threonine protein kinase
MAEVSCYHYSMVREWPNHEICERSASPSAKLGMFVVGTLLKYVESFLQTLGISFGIEYLHRKGVVHGDVKPVRFPSLPDVSS